MNQIRDKKRPRFNRIAVGKLVDLSLKMLKPNKIVPKTTQTKSCANQSNLVLETLLNHKNEESTGEVTDGDGDGGDGGETDVVERAEVGDGLCKRRVAIDHRVLRLC